MALAGSSCGIRALPIRPDAPPPARTVVRAADGTPLAYLFEQNRAPLAAARIPRLIKDAVVAAEDGDFWHHRGIDPRAMVRAAAATVGGRLQGGSTITQQVVKLLAAAHERTLGTKVGEALSALELERRYSKERILAMYLNRAYFGARAYGIAAAAHTYFGLPVARLRLHQAALLAGLVRAPSRLNPLTDPRAARARRSYVLRRMREERMITRSEQQRADAAPLGVRYRRAGVLHAPWFVGYVEQQLLADPSLGPTRAGRAEALRTGGLDIRTTLDLRMQRAAERAIARSLNRPGDPEAALVAIDPRTGEIRAMVGGRNPVPGTFNLATHGRRQAGSTFKPFVLIAAMEQGISPWSSYESAPEILRFGTGGRERWPVDNFDGRDRGPLSLWEGMVHSVNGVYARLALDVGADHVVDVARRLGITARLSPFPSIALGALPIGVSPLEMASAYGTFALLGRRADPHAIRAVETRDGAMLLDRPSPHPVPAVDRGIAVMINRVLADTARRGTAASGWLGRPTAAKTGTTEDHADAWFIGYTPQLVTAVWVGYRAARRPMRNVHGTAVTGSSFPAAIWRSFMRTALHGRPVLAFPEPEGALMSVSLGAGGTCIAREGGTWVELPPLVVPIRACAAPSPSPSPSDLPPPSRSPLGSPGSENP